MPGSLARLALFSRFARQAAALAALTWLAACSTAPGKAEVEAPAANPTTSAAAVAPAPVTAAVPLRFDDNSGGPGDAADLPVLSEGLSVLSAAADDEAQPSLQAGEALREFQRGHASWYGPGFNGRRTASGERFDMHDFTAAHRTLPFGTVVRVHSLVNGRDVDVRITDRGPYAGNRIIDLSRAAAEELGMLGLGFKEVVLLVPESASGLPDTQLWPLPKKPSRPVRRAAPARTR